MARHDQLGGKLAPKLAQIVAHAMTEHLRSSADHRAKIGAEGANEFFRGVNAEIRATVGPIYQAAAAHPDMPEELRPLMAFLHAAPGEWSALMSYGIYGLGVGSSFSQLIGDLMAPWVQTNLAANPNAVLTPTAAADLYAKGLMQELPAALEAAKSAMNAERFQLLADAAVTFPSFADLNELVNRGVINADQAHGALRRTNYTDEWAAAIEQLRHAILPADIAALLVLRSAISEDDGRRIAGLSGYSPSDFDLMVEATGEPPGLEQLDEAYRRGFIDQARLVRGIKQSRVRDEWVDVVEKLRYAPMATADAVDAVVRNYITSAEGQRIAEENGLEPEHWSILLAAHGRPIATGQALELYNRGEFTADQVRQVVRESDIKDKYVDQVLALHRRLPAERLVMNIVTHGGATVQRGIQMLLDLGYDRTTAGEITAAASNQRTTAHKNLSEAQTVALYRERAIDHARATAMLEAIGYTAEEVTLILELADLEVEHHYRTQAIAAVRGGYLAHHLTLQEAEGELGKLGLPVEQVQYVTTLWQLEISAHARTLTEAQVVKGNKLGLIADADAASRLQRMGYSALDADLLLKGA